MRTRFEHELMARIARLSVEKRLSLGVDMETFPHQCHVKGSGRMLGDIELTPERCRCSGRHHRLNSMAPETDPVLRRPATRLA
jgi:hypothetical protein